ncbi:MAG: mRNA surveillance protein pelota [Candidatus Aenigmarchaeota archaeon]|nr:mRNA surveillance protein pelota [Candidatus Aenigmarchaeota archaeon]
MRILKKDMKNMEITLLVESLDDIWHLENIIDTGDIIKAKTMRKVSLKKAGEYEYGEKRPMILTIKAEKVEFQKDSGILRITGPIIEGPEDVPKQSYHTIQINVNTTVSIIKEWKKYHLDRLEKAKIKKPSLFICILDREKCEFFVLKESGLERIGSIENYDKENMDSYREQIYRFLKKQTEFDKMVIAGPGFERENLFKYISEKDRGLSNKVILEHSSSPGLTGANEVIKKSANRILRDTRIAKESGHVQEIMKRIKTDGLVVYGPRETEKAVKIGAVETLFISQKKVKEFEKLMELQEKMGGNVIIIGDDHETGEQFLHIGGIAGFLRFRIE